MNNLPILDRIAALRASNAQHAESLPDLLDQANVTIRHLQARIDQLMLEHCPHEMTTEQIANLASHHVTPHKELTP